MTPLAFGFTFGDEFDGSMEQTGHEEAHARHDKCQGVGARSVKHLTGDRWAQQRSHA